MPDDTPHYFSDDELAAFGHRPGPNAVLVSIGSRWFRRESPGRWLEIKPRTVADNLRRES